MKERRRRGVYHSNVTKFSRYWKCSALQTVRAPIRSLFAFSYPFSHTHTHRKRLAKPHVHVRVPKYEAPRHVRNRFSSPFFNQYPQLSKPFTRMVSISATEPARIRPLTASLCLQPRPPPNCKRSPSAQVVLGRSKAHTKVSKRPHLASPLICVPPRSAFFGLPHSQLPPQRRITQDDAPSMMPHPTQNTSHQGGGHNAMAQAAFGPSQSHSKPSSAASFASLSGSGPYGGGQGTSGHVRKKARLA